MKPAILKNESKINSFYLSSKYSFDGSDITVL